MIEPTRLDWVESLGGPLVLVPDSCLDRWTGALDEEDVPPEEVDDLGLAGDYSLACAVEDYLGNVPVGGGAGEALVLGDCPDTTAFLPSHGCLVRWRGADSERQILAHVDAALAGAVWLERVRWRTDGDAVLCDAATSGEETRRGAWPDGRPIASARVPLEAGEYEARTAEVSNAGRGPSFGLVVLERIGP
ncbi:immunity protein 21 of polymorphic toxin system [Nocardiopsis sp. Huas11]|uniref:Imm21 family immunity protein n=1 Tax=Nocardiopsis sp. Huas11 TaxID=2183912 RepID=UPI000EB19D01|nr:Imm21 family immunity protein [Nocardiopsis sp. Huas11]RKS10187.1 immunity protein 21 of polymorphic toxin system [Nocardiopsis sp. Huas11]